MTRQSAGVNSTSLGKRRSSNCWCWRTDTAREGIFSTFILSRTGLNLSRHSSSIARRLFSNSSMMLMSGTPNQVFLLQLDLRRKNDDNNRERVEDVRHD